MKDFRGEHTKSVPESTFRRRRTLIAGGAVALTFATAAYAGGWRPVSTINWAESNIGAKQPEKSHAVCVTLANNKLFTDWDIAAAIANHTANLDRTANDVYDGDIGETVGNTRNFDDGYLQPGGSVNLSVISDCRGAMRAGLVTKILPVNH